ncbi:MAG: tetratricopeptide repeat protein [Verrucomicrobiota bacterium]
MNQTVAEHLTRAEGFLELGMHDEAWEALNDVEPEAQRYFPLVALRLSILIVAKSWLKAEILADSIIQALPENAPAWYALAQALAQQEKLADARDALKRACALDSTIKSMCLKDEILKDLWLL